MKNNAIARPLLSLRSWLFMMLLTALVSSFLLSGAATAQEVDPGIVIETSEATQNMEVGPNDFGQALINFVTYGSYSPADKSAPSMLGTIAKVVCALALFMMAALTVIGGANYIIQTANKGVPGGQVISSFWTPLRISVATILLIPFPGGPGFSTLQLGVTKVAEIGNAHGGWLSKEGINHFVHYGAYQPPTMRDSSETATSLVASEMCMLHVNTAQRKSVVKREYKVVGESHTLHYNYHDPASRRGMRHVPNFCGGVELTIPDSEDVSGLFSTIWRTAGRYATMGAVQTQASTERLAAQNIATNYKPFIIDIADGAKIIAAKLAGDSKALAELQDGQETPENFQQSNDAALTAGTSLGDELRALQSRTNSGLQGLVARAVNSARSEAEGSWSDEINSLGWTALGTMYWQQSNDQKMINSIAGALTPVPLPAEATGDFGNDKRFQDLQARFADMVVSSLNTKPSQPAEFGEILSITEAGSDGEGWYKSLIAGLTQSVMRSMVTSENADFVNKMQSTGHTLTSLADLAIHSSIWISGTAKGVAAASVFATERVTDAAGGIPVVGKFISAAGAIGGAPVVGLAVGGADIIHQYATFAKQLVLPLIISGFILAIVLPTLPLFFWLMGVVSWILFYIECLLVSPFWLAAHGTAEKEGWGTEHTRQGYMLMIGLYLNPILRVAGFFAIMVVLFPLGVLVTWLSSYLQGVLSGGFVTSPFLLVGSMLVLAFFAYSVAVRVFSVPNELFERGLRWINGGQEVTGDEGGAQRINAMMATFNHKSESLRRGTPVTVTPLDNDFGPKSSGDKSPSTNK